MKKIQLVLLVAISTFTFSCGNDDDASDAELTQANFEGTYNITFIQFDGTEVSTDPTDGTTTTDTYTDVGSNFNDSTVEFTSNGTVNFDLDYTETYTYNGQPDGSDIIQEQYSGTYVLNIENETVTLGDETYEITTFNGNDLVLSSTENEVNGDYTSTYNTEIRMSK